MATATPTTRANCVIRCCSGVTGSASPSSNCTVHSFVVSSPAPDVGSVVHVIVSPVCDATVSEYSVGAAGLVGLISATTIAEYAAKCEASAASLARLYLCAAQGSTSCAVVTVELLTSALGAQTARRSGVVSGLRPKTTSPRHAPRAKSNDCSRTYAGQSDTPRVPRSGLTT